MFHRFWFIVSGDPPPPPLRRLSRVKRHKERTVLINIWSTFTWNLWSFCNNAKTLSSSYPVFLVCFSWLHLKLVPPQTHVAHSFFFIKPVLRLQVCLSCLFFFLQCRQIFAGWNRCITLCLPRAYTVTKTQKWISIPEYSYRTYTVTNELLNVSWWHQILGRFLWIQCVSLSWYNCWILMLFSNRFAL